MVITMRFRLYSSDGHALIDLMMRPGEDPPEVGKRVLCRHPFEESKRAYVMPHKVEPLYKVSLTVSPLTLYLLWPGGLGGGGGGCRHAQPGRGEGVREGVAEDAEAGSQEVPQPNTV